MSCLEMLKKKEGRLLLTMSSLLLVLLDETEKQLKVDFNAKKQVLGIQRLPNNLPESGFTYYVYPGNPVNPSSGLYNAPNQN